MATSKAVPPGQHGAPSQQYIYTKLNDLTENSSRVNLWAVIKFFKEPQRSRGTDFFQMLSVVDDSLDPKDPSAKLVCIIFSGDVKTFPNIRRTGDLIRLHRFNIKPYISSSAVGGQSQAISSLQAVSTYGFSWVIVDGDPSAEIQPKSISAEFTFSDSDRARVRELRSWYVRNHVQSIDSGITDQTNNNSTVYVQESANAQSDSVKWLDSVGLNCYFDVPAMVIGIGVKSADRCVLFVTDGSVLNRGAGGKSLPPFLVIDPSELTSLQMDNSLFDRFSKSMVAVSVFDDHCSMVQLLKPGDVVYMKNLHCTLAKSSSLAAVAVGVRENHPTVASPYAELILHGKTHYGRGLRKMSQDEALAKTLNSRIDAMISENENNAAMLVDGGNHLGPFAEVLDRQPRYQTRHSPRNAKASAGWAEDADDWEFIKMRDVSTQTDCS